MPQIIRLELIVLNQNKYDSRVAYDGDRNTWGDIELRSSHSFKEGLHQILLQAFDDMWNDLGIHRLKCIGSISEIKSEPVATLSDAITLDAENMTAVTTRGYVTFLYLKERFKERMDNISHAAQLLTWDLSRHFSEDSGSRFRSCVVCGRVQWQKPTGQIIGGKERYFSISDHCFNPNCFSHTIEQMIDPEYVFVPPKPGEGLEAYFARSLGDGVVKKDHPVGTGATKVVKKGT